MFFDAHFHYAVCLQKGLFDLIPDWKGLSCAHSLEEWETQQKGGNNIFQAFGIHPQIVGKLSQSELSDYMNFMENLCSTGEVNALGEIGFDLFNDDFKISLEKQKVVWDFEIKLAQKYNLPVVIHCRKGNHYLFEYSKELKKLPAVLFHSFMGSFVECESLIKRDINCFFSFGKQMMNNNKKVIECVSKLPIKNLLLETDAPFQTLKGELNTYPKEIINIYNYSKKLRNENNTAEKNVSFEDYCELISKNAHNLVSSIQI